MTTEAQAINPPLGAKPSRLRAPAADSPSPSYREQLRAELKIGRLLEIGAIAVQFTLIVVAIRLLNLESGGFKAILTLSLGGFLINHYLPARWRIGFFAAISVASLPLIFGGPHALWILGIGGVLIALCHVPIAMWARIALVLLAAVLLAFERKQALGWNLPHAPAVIWPVLGSMFMYRLIIYMHDLKHGAGPFSLQRALAYFFMLPNVCFPLFPVVDYKTFQRSAYNEEALRVYQTGIRWMLRGLTHLVLYKIVYFMGVIEPADALTGTDTARYVFVNFALYLKVSGLFHLIAGLLRMYGFGVSETHHLYFFASSFIDLWRRMNIYWKEFIQKILFNPLYFAFRRQGEMRAIAVAALLSFGGTWFLHSYQWFWIIGEFPLTGLDLFFYSAFLTIAFVNLVREAKASQQAPRAKQVRTLKQNSWLALQIASTFLTFSVLWAIWSTPNAGDRQALWQALLNSGPRDFAVILGVPLFMGVLGALFRDRLREGAGGGARFAPAAPLRLWRQAALISLAVCAFIFVAVRPALVGMVSPSLATLIGDVRNGRLNKADIKKLQGNYYAELLGDTNRVKAPAADVADLLGGQAVDWGDPSKTRRMRDDAIGAEFIPSTSAVYKGAKITINSLGMRDREYTAQPGPNVFRIALVGSSHDMGMGVEDNETYENLVEDRLNRELGPRTGKKYEILNFSYGGYDPIQKLAVVQQKMYAYRPDVILFAAYSVEPDWVFKSVPRLMQNHHLDEFPYLASALQRAGVQAAPAPGDMATLERKLKPFAAETVGAIFKSFHDDALAHGVRPVVLLMEATDDSATRSEKFDEVARLAQSAGLPVLDMQGAYASISDRKSLWIATWDTHTNAMGHRLLAERLYSLLLNQHMVPTEPGAAPREARK